MSILLVEKIIFYYENKRLFYKEYFIMKRIEEYYNLKRIPKHIAIIPDGNRRWAKLHGLNKEDGYDYGLEPGLKLLRLAKKCGIKEITYYGFTVDNCKRPKEQVEAFSRACVDAVKMLERENANLYVVGNYESKCFPKELIPYTIFNREKIIKKEYNVNLINNGKVFDNKNQENKNQENIIQENIIQENIKEFNDCHKINVNFLVNYGWEWDMKNNWVSRNIPRVDLVIRWGGMRRLSGLLPLQTVYADICVIDDLWPDFTEEQFIGALEWYQVQDVTLGG